MQKRMTPVEQVCGLDVAPRLPGAEDIAAMANRQAVMDLLYDLDGRKSVSHPLHGLYTGLAGKCGELMFGIKKAPLSPEA